MKRQNKKQLKTDSKEQADFIKNHKNYYYKIKLYRILILLCFLSSWEYASTCGIIDSFFFSSPSQILTLFLKMCKNQSIFLHITVTLYETIISFLLVLSLSFIISSILWYFNELSDILEPFLVILNSLPKSALAPLFIVWIGTGIKTIIIAGTSVAIFGSIISFYSSFQHCDPEKIKLIYTLGGKKKDVFFKVILPTSLPVILSTTKVNIGLSLVGVIIGEFLAAKKGLGYLIIYGSQIFQLDLVITSIILLCFIAISFYQGIHIIEKNLTKKWHL